MNDIAFTVGRAFCEAASTLPINVHCQGVMPQLQSLGYILMFLTLAVVTWMTVSKPRMG